MADFYQNGIITTLHNLANRSVDDMEKELLTFRQERPMAVILPSLFSELEGPALSGILDELRHAPYLDEVVIGLDRANEQQFRYALQFFSKLPQKFSVLWNDGPALQAVHKKLEAKGLAPQQAGKGRNVWYCMGYVLAATRAEAIALHDCDITTYKRDLLARLIYPVANPKFNYEFCKGFYARVADGKFNGRASRLLVSPLLNALKKIHGELDYLQYMDSFRYSLAGEFSFRRDVLNDIRIPSDWGLEIGVLSEMHRNYSLNRLCQVDIADTYDHKHQDLSTDNDQGGLSKMSIDISKALFRKLATQGITFNTETFRSLKATYYRLALDFVDAYHNDAVINNLSFDIDKEERAVEMFAENIMKAGEIFLDRPMETPFIPSWNRVRSAFPDVFNELAEAVASDRERYA
jgi:glucosyl-3-phosphoglycerate synthase